MDEKRILIVEDSIEWQKVHASLLKEYSTISLVVDMACCAREGLEFVNEHLDKPYDLIISDLQMESEFEPDMAGEWFVKQVKDIRQYYNVPIVLISAVYNIDFIASQLGVNCLSKRSLINNSNSYNLMLDEYLL